MVNSAHGFSDWAWQRISAGLMLLYFIMLPLRLWLDAPELQGLDIQQQAQHWQAWCHPLWFKLSSLIFAWALIYHAWIGVKEITMDYLHHPVVRSRVQALAKLASAIYALIILIIVWIV